MFETIEIPEPQFAQLSAARLAWTSFGAQAQASGEPVLLLIRGLGTQSIEWPKALVDGFVSSGRRVVVFDNRDCGLSSDHAGETYTMSDMARDCVELLDALGVEQADVFGISMGGMIVQRLLIEHPERLRRAVSVMSSTGARDLPGPTAEALAALQAPAPETLEAAIEQNAEGRAVFGSPGDPLDAGTRSQLARRALERAWRPDGVARQYAAILADGSRREALASVDTPVLVIHGADDALVPLAGGEDTARSIPGAALHVVAGMGHDLPPAFVEEIVGVTVRFLDGVDSD